MHLINYRRQIFCDDTLHFGEGSGYKVTGTSENY